MLVSHETLREVALYHRVSIRVVHSIVERVKKKTLLLKYLCSVMLIKTKLILVLPMFSLFVVF